MATNKPRIIFVTGTDTGVGKTVLTCLALLHLRDSGQNALAMKPFCTGAWDDVRLLYQAQDRALPMREINPFHYKPPVAPLVAARLARAKIPLNAVLSSIHNISSRCEVLIVEGAGGLLVPLGEGYTVADVIAGLACSVILVVKNKLGAVNHTLLTLGALEQLRIKDVRVALMEPIRPSLAARTNAGLIKDFSGLRRVFAIPDLGANASKIEGLRRSAKSLKKTLARLLHDATLCVPGGPGSRR